MRTDFTPLIFANDINAYSIARAFHEEYGMISDVRGKYNRGHCVGSKITRYEANEKADEREVFLAIVSEFAARHAEKKVIIIGCGDNYVRLISENLDHLPDNVIAPYMRIEVMHQLLHKETFYALCERKGVDHPATFVYKKDTPKDFELPFEPPYMLKPSNGVQYWRHPFPTQKKVYKLDSRAELDQVLEQIYGAGYEDSIVIQDFIPGDDSYKRTLTSYSDQQGKVRMTCLGHVLLEEHTPRGLGSDAVTVTEHNPELENRMVQLLEDIPVVGFTNFDMKYDQRDGKYKVFEINVRQGRSNYYVTSAGENLAKHVVEDRVDQKAFSFKAVDAESLFWVVPRKVAFDYIQGEADRALMRRLIREGKYANPLFYHADAGFVRKLRLWKGQFGYVLKYRKHLGKKRREN